MNDQAPMLSPEGCARCESMRGELLDVLARTKRRRRARRQVTGSIAAILLVVGTSWIALNRSSPPPAAALLGVQIVRTTPSTTSSWIVRTDPSALANATSAAPSNNKIERINDDQLITQLAAIGKLTGIARSGDRVWLTDDIFAEPALDQLNNPN